MLSLLLGMAVASSAPAHAAVVEMDVESCMAQRLRPFVGPAGVRKPWPIVTQVPRHLRDRMGVQISSQGVMSDGYNHWLLLDRDASAAWVVQRGGYAGRETFYGPFQLASCPQVAAGT